MNQTRFLIAPNPFKGTLSALEAARAMARGLRRALPGCHLDVMPLADGGPGTLRAVGAALGRRARFHHLDVRGPLGRKVRAALLELPGRKALIESAQAIGLHLLRPGPRTAMKAGSYGLGQLMNAADNAGCREIWIGLGGSACTDGGLGMARARGWEIRDRRGGLLRPSDRDYGQLDRGFIRTESARPWLPKFAVLCDVDNPLYGRRGAAFVYAPQKGATPSQVRRLDRGLRRLARAYGRKAALAPGAGAAGGLGAGLMVFEGARLVPGARTLLKLCGFGRRLRRCGVVLTGEGRFDAQTRAGKLPWVLAQAAKRAGKRCVVFAGSARGRRGGLEVRTLEGWKGGAAARLEAAVGDWARRA